jgi:hypothetical protein
MRERAASLGGSIKTRSAVVGGTVVSLRFRPRALLSTDENGVPSMPPAARAADGR